MWFVRERSVGNVNVKSDGPLDKWVCRRVVGDGEVNPETKLCLTNVLGETSEVNFIEVVVVIWSRNKKKLKERSLVEMEETYVR